MVLFFYEMKRAAMLASCSPLIGFVSVSRRRFKRIKIGLFDHLSTERSNDFFGKLVSSLTFGFLFFAYITIIAINFTMSIRLKSYL